MFDYKCLGSLNRQQFSECLFSYIGHSHYDRNQSTLIFNRYDTDRNDRISYGEFCKLVVPFDQETGARLVGRGPVADRLSYDT